MLSSLLLGSLWWSSLLEQPPVSWYAAGVLAFSLAAIAELLSEPLWLMAQAHQYVSLKVGYPSCSPA